MNSWGLEHADRTGTHAAMADVVDAIGRERFATRALASLSPVLGIGSWAV